VLAVDRSDPASVAAPTDRYEPLPGLLGLPAHFLRKLSPRGRKIAAVIGVLLLAAGVTATILLAPQISESKREHAAAERQARIRANEQERARLIAEQRPRRGRLAPGTGTGAAVATIERAITRDAQARAARGELESRARYTNCRSLGLEGRRLQLACTAITSETKTSEDVSGVVVGYSYRAAVSPDGRRFAFCKTSGRPAVGFSTEGLPAVELPPVCGG
jgi:hypothetical protein